MHDNAAFRALFPSLQRVAWFNTPGSAPGATPIAGAVRAALDAWLDGSFDPHQAEMDADATRALFGRLVHASPENVSLAASLSDCAAATAKFVARKRPTGAIVVGDREFRSNLMPWLELEAPTRPMVFVKEPPGRSWTEAVVDHIRPNTAMVALSEVQSASGQRLALDVVARRCREVGALLFLNLTQSLGVHPIDVTALGADFVAAHGYKWLLAPRGAAWLYVADQHVSDFMPLAPNWRNTVDDRANMYGRPAVLAGSAKRADSSPAWFSWIGGRAALELLNTLRFDEVSEHCTSLARSLRNALDARGFPGEASEYDPPSHIVSVRSNNAETQTRLLAESGVIASTRDGLLRFGVHYFNTPGDVQRALQALH